MNQNHKSRSSSHVCAYALILLIGLCWSTVSEPTPIIQTIKLPTINTEKIPLLIQTETNKSSTIGFPDINFEISSRFYTHNGTVPQEKMYKKQMYTESVDQYCKLYKTSILAETKARQKYADNVQSLSYTVYNHDNANVTSFYMLGSDSNLYIYGYDKENIMKTGVYPVEYKVGRVRDGELQDNVELFVVGDRLFIANNDSLWVLDQAANNNNYFSQVQGYQALPRLVGAGLVAKHNDDFKLQNSSIWVCSDTQILVFRFAVSGFTITVQNIIQYTPVPQTISAISYDIASQYFYLTAARSLYIFKLGSVNSLAQYEVNGVCTHINLIKSTLFLGCQYEKISFVTELRIQNFTRLVLNRYYDEDFLEGIRDVEYLGNDKVALIGDEQAIIIGQAVNRHVLLDLADADTTQNYEYAYSFSLKDLYYVPQYSTPQHSVIFVVGDSSISVHKITYQPPQIQCNFRNHPVSTVSILVLFNTSHCPFLVDEEFELNGTYTLCETAIPLRMQFAKRQYEEKTAKIIFFVVMLIGIVSILMCAGFGIKIRNKANQLIERMREKIDKVRKQHETSEMKKL